MNVRPSSLGFLDGIQQSTVLAIQKGQKTGLRALRIRRSRWTALARRSMSCTAIGISAGGSAILIVRTDSHSLRASLQLGRVAM